MITNRLSPVSMVVLEHSGVRKNTVAYAKKFSWGFHSVAHGGHFIWCAMFV